jgi:hypothetical protein
MTSLAHTSTLDWLHPWSVRTTTTRASGRLRLLASGDGWSLVSPDGHLVFQALGIHGRRRCLEYAHSEGVLAVLS